MKSLLFNFLFLVIIHLSTIEGKWDICYLSGTVISNSSNYECQLSPDISVPALTSRQKWNIDLNCQSPKHWVSIGRSGTMASEDSEFRCYVQCMNIGTDS